MNIVIIGGAGLVGQKLAQDLTRRGTLRGQAIGSLTLADVVDPVLPEGAGPGTRGLTCDITDPAAIRAAIPDDTQVVFHLAAVVSAHAEAAFDEGMAINLSGTLGILERCRALPVPPVLVFTSTAAVYGGAVPDPITEASFLNPQTSYGTQKAIGELLLNDYSRKGFVDGRALRLPTISVRPGKPNRAASSFMSSIIREPLNGQEAICPVTPDFLHYYLSPRRCIENLVRTAELDAADLGQNRVLQMPGRTWSIAEVIDALTEVAGPEPARLIRFEDDPVIRAIVSGWRYDIHADRALSLGLVADDSFADNVRFYIEDDLPKAAAPA